MFFKEPTGLDVTNRLFYLLDLNYQNLYIDNGVEFNENEYVKDDVYFSQLRSFAMCRAEEVADNRLHRLDEFKSITDQIYSKDAYKRYMNFRREIIKSKNIELPDELLKSLDEEEKKRVNTFSANQMQNINK